MKLPNADRAEVTIRKLRDYCLNPAHPEGRHKARRFKAALGLTVADAQELRTALLDAATTGNATRGTQDQFGTRYVLDFEMRRAGSRASIRSAWIVRTNESQPRFVTCYVL